MFKKMLFILALTSATSLSADAPCPAEPSAAELPATLVTLHLKDVPFRAAMEKLLETTHGSLRAPAEDFLKAYGEKKVTLDLNRQPFWEALRQLCEQAEVSPESGEADLLMFGDQGEWAARPRIVAGPFMLQAVSASISAQGWLGRVPRFAPVQCNLKLSILAEPNASAIRIDAIRVTEAVDDAGGAIPVLPTSKVLQPRFRNRWCSPDIHLQAGADAHAIARIKGEIDIAVETKSSMMEFRGIGMTAEAEQQVGPLHCTLKSRLVEASCEVDIEFSDPRKDPALCEPIWSDMRMTWPVLTDASGRPFAFGSSRGGGGAFSVSSNMTFIWRTPKGLKDRPQLPLKVVWRIPTQSKIVKLPFEFKDLPLPNRDLKMRAIGVGKARRPPLPPNRTGGSPASGSPVNGSP